MLGATQLFRYAVKFICNNKMSDQQFGKKEVERDELYPFIESYNYITGENLSAICDGESPDFICSRSSGKKVGIELTKITGSPEAFDVLSRIYNLIENKKTKVSKYAEQVKDNMLVLQLVVGSLDSLIPFLEGLENDYTDHKFCEVWIADYSVLDAFGVVDLFGLYPKVWWGYHQPPPVSSKPYG